MPSWLLVLLIPFAVYRATYMVSQEDGPFTVFARLRFAMEDNTIGDMLKCVYCVSVWFAGLFLLYYELPLYDWFIGTLAVSALAMWIHHGVQR